MHFSPIDPLTLLRTMALSREGDRREGILFRQGRGWLQVPAAGHETLAALGQCLEPQDFIFPYYRERPLALARGVTNYELALAFFARSGSCSEGRMMSSHYSDPNLRIIASATPTGLQCLPAVGTAWACKLKQEKAVALCCIGDAALRQGEFYEAWCFALQENLPIVFVVEDNGYGISTPTEAMTPWNIGALSSERRMVIDGRQVEEVSAAGRHLIQQARENGGPGVLWMEIDRLWPHTASDDHHVYRSAQELEAMAARDPLHLFKDQLVQRGLLTEEEWQREMEEIARSVEEDYLQAECAPVPSLSLINDEIELEARAIEIPDVYLAECGEEHTMLTSFRETLHHIFAQEQNAVYFGEDVADPKGGVFGLTKGLSTTYPDRVFNSPLAEATIVGTAVGMAAAGLKPFFEIQFVDFIGPAYNQLANQVATLRWRSAGKWKCPAVFLMPYGGYLPAGGPWHSQSNEALFAHIPGLLVACPSTPQDVAALLYASCGVEDPVIFLLPKHLLRRKGSTNATSAAGFGQAAIRREGRDVTIVAWGNCVEVALAAAAELGPENIDAEVIDLRTLVPCDWGTILTSIEKTGRLIVVQEDNVTCGFGQSVIAHVTTNREFWNQLAALPQLVARPDTHIPFHPDLEMALLPSPADVREAVLATFSS